MNEYSTLPRMFRPEPRDRATLFLIKVPDEKLELSRQEYYELLGQRIEWMIHQWLRVETLNQTHDRMSNALSRLCCYQQPPRLTEEADWAWTAEWAATFLEYNDVLGTKLEQEFPVELRMMNLDIEDQWRLSHDHITLADWLGSLTRGRGINDLPLS
jgi:hypothetical protein